MKKIIVCSYFCVLLLAQDSLALLKIASFPVTNFAARKYDSIILKYSKPDSIINRSVVVDSFLNHSYLSTEFIFDDFDLAYITDESNKPSKLIAVELKGDLQRTNLPRWLRIGKTSLDETQRKLVGKGILITEKQIEFTALDKNGNNVKVTLFFDNEKLAKVKWNF